MNLYQRVYETVKKIPKGKVMSYGQIALLLGNKRLSQRVGFALHANPDPGSIPCHRVVNRYGELSKSFAFGGLQIQKQKLLAEGIEFDEQDRVKKEFFITDLNNL